MNAPQLDSLLQRQLRRLAVSAEEPPSLEVWARVLAMVSEQYQKAASDRSMLARSIEISTAEMDELRVNVEQLA